MKTITVTITKDAKVRVATDGFVGAECKDATRALETALGTTINDTPTAEMYNDPVEVTRGAGR